MVADEVKQICREIRMLKIQGAREIAKAAVKALGLQAKKSKAKKPLEFIGELVEAADALAATRPTEPMLRNSLRNAIRHVFVQIRKNKATTVKQLKQIVTAEEANYFRNIEAALKNIAEYGAKEIPQGATVLTHCHSSTVMAVLKRAHEMAVLERQEVVVHVDEEAGRYAIEKAGGRSAGEQKLARGTEIRGRDIVFYPKGNSSGGVITLRDGKGREYTVEIDRTLGSTKVRGL